MITLYVKKTKLWICRLFPSGPETTDGKLYCLVIFYKASFLIFMTKLLIPDICKPLQTSSRAKTQISNAEIKLNTIPTATSWLSYPTFAPQTSSEDIRHSHSSTWICSERFRSCLTVTTAMQHRKQIKHLQAQLDIALTRSLRRSAVCKLPVGTAAYTSLLREEEASLTWH